MSSIVTNAVSTSVLDGIIGVQGTRRNLDSSTDERRCISLTADDVALYKDAFKYNNGKASDGKDVHINGPEMYFRLPVNIHMIDQEHISLNTIGSFMYNCEERAKEREAAIQVFVDGLKIPDKEIIFYPTKSNVDVFIPLKYINEVRGNSIIVEKKRYDYYTYLHTYVKESSSQFFSIPVEEKDQKLVSERGVIIYVNRKLYTYKRILTFEGNVLRIRLSTEIEDGSEVEIIVDPYVMYNFPSQTYPSTDKEAIFEIPESYIDSIHGPISRFSCAFYIDGLRIPNTAVKQKGRLHFTYPLTNNRIGGVLSFYLSDRNLIIDKETTLYGSDYYLYNFVGCQGITNTSRKTYTEVSRFIDAGADKTISVPVIYRRGSYSVQFTLPEGIYFLHDEKETVKYTTLKNGTELVIKESDIALSEEENGLIKVTISNPSDYFEINVDATVTIDIKSWFSWDSVLNHDDELFARETVKAMVSIFNQGYDPSERVANLLSRYNNHPYVMRSFLENFGYDTEFYSVEYDGISQNVYFGLPPEYDVTSGKAYDISVNNRHIPSEDVNIISKDLTDIFQVPGKYFNKGSNEVDIQIIDKVELSWIDCKVEDISFQDGIYILEIDASKLGNLGDYTSNVILLEKVKEGDDENVVNFPTNYNTGYRMFSSSKYSMVYYEDYNRLFITFTERPDYDFIVYNKNFALSYKYIKPATADITDVTIPIYAGSTVNPIPYIPRGNVFVYNGKDKLVENVDYFLKNPENDPTVGGTYIIMKRAVLPGSTVDIYFTNFKTNIVLNRSGYFQNNRYGLFYLGQLRYPFSMKYMNLYINGKKLGEADVDVLSDKLIRIHSMPTPLYDLAVETAFTVDDTELEPFIQEYKEDDFELYLARLFRGIDYTRDFSNNEEAADDPNDIYETFVETVDSVNRVPNPVARDGEWIPSYNDDPNVIGPHNDGSATDGNNINTCVLVGNMFVVGADNGKVASCIVDNTSCLWRNCNQEVYDGENYIVSNGEEFENENITASVLYNGYVVFGTESGKLVAFNTGTKRWITNPSTLPFLDTSKWPENTRINGFLVDSEKNMLVMYGDNGSVDSYVWDNAEWNGNDMTKTESLSFGITGLMGNIYGAFKQTFTQISHIVFVGENGEAASVAEEYNSWIKPDGTIVSMAGVYPKIKNDGSYRNNSTIRSVSKYFDYQVLVGDDGIVTFFDTQTSQFVNEDNLNICDLNGSNMKGNQSRTVEAFDDRLILVGGQDGKVSNYVGENQDWYNCDSGNGITSDGKYMEGNTINCSLQTSGETDYIIFAGDSGKVCSYNIDTHEVPFRYDTYKSVFLKWYTTEGNATIRTKWDIPERISRMFDMYKESNTGTDDICIRGGDNDLMMDIYMNDFGKYPWTLEARRRFIAEFIADLPEGKYTLDEVLELYRNSPASNMLYEKDLITLRSGDSHDKDEIKLITQEPS